MCGIAGIFDIAGIKQPDIEMVKQMNQVQKHRGPDDEGLYFDDYCVLGHRRLAIIDLSKAGHQPFHSDDGTHHLIYNGEIYNYIELRKELQQRGIDFNTRTDVEVLLKAYIEYGVECLYKFNGMFAFAIYNSENNTLFIARDRVGIKPFYYFYNGIRFCFSSEIKALRGIKGVNLHVNYHALFDYLCFNRTDVYDETFHQGIKRLPKGHYGIIDTSGLRITQWWNPEHYIENHTSDSFPTMTATIENLLISSVKFRMRSDVSVGSCLSGGLDSSILTGILQEHFQMGNAYKTFTVSFPGHPIDETHYVNCFNQKYPFQNFRTTPTAEGAFDHLQTFVYQSDEPTLTPSFYAQFELMRLARKNGITVLLDGQGGDENFAGYQYLHGFYFTGLFKKYRYGTLGIEFIKSLLRRQEKEAFQTFLFQLLPDSIRKALLLKKLPYMQPDFFYKYIETSRIYNEFFTAKNLNESLVKHFQYKLEHLLRTEDRNSMAFHIEARVPYLDHRLIEYCLSIPEQYKIHRGENKLLQKQAVGKYSVPEITNRLDKIGFGTPCEEWMSTNVWKNLTKANYSYLTKTFPEIFRKNVNLSPKSESWKINQLATWKNLS